MTTILIIILILQLFFLITIWRGLFWINNNIIDLGVQTIRALREINGHEEQVVDLLQSERKGKSHDSRT